MQLHPADQVLASQMVVGDHSKDDFRTPQQVTTQDEQQGSAPASALGAPEKPKKRSLRVWFHDLSKKQKIIFWLVTVLIIAGLAGGAYYLFFRTTTMPGKVVTVNKKPIVKEPPKPVTEASKLSGLQVDPSVNARTVTGVMIENSQDARPQSGLEQASVVFEAIAEGGITRFLALYQDNVPAYLGPIRSVRPYYLQWLQGFDAPVAHVGGSPEALQDIKTWGVKDLDQFFNGTYYHRITSRVAPHNVYTSMVELNQLEVKKGITGSTFTGFLRKAEEPSKAPTVHSIDLNISSAFFNVHYDYDPVTNSYKRSEGGAPHLQIDQNGVRGQLAPKVVVALVMQQGIEADDLHTSYAATGSGRAFIFQDGLVADQAIWHKASNTDQITFTDTVGGPLKLNPGQTWLTAVGSADRVIYR